MTIHLRVVIACTQVGMSNAAIATCTALERYHPDVVINQGTSGGHVRELAPFDIVIGRVAMPIHHLVMPIREAGQGSDALQWQPGPRSEPLDADSALVQLARSVPYDGGQLCVGTLGSGDLFSREVDRIDWLHAQYEHLCEDMETATVYRACQAYGVPVLGVRIIANNELTGQHDAPGSAFFPKAKALLQDYVLRLIRVIAQARPQVEYSFVDTDNRDAYIDYIRRHWGDTRMVQRGRMVDTAESKRIMAALAGEVIAVCGYKIENQCCEILVLDSSLRNRGIGSALIERVKAIAREQGRDRLVLLTTNDNIHALHFYRKRGFNLAGVNQDSLEYSRRLKPGIPLIGEHDIPPRHEIEFSMAL